MSMADTRQRIHEIADEYAIPELHDLAEATRRRWHGRRAPDTQVTPVGEEAARIRTFAIEHPRMTLFDIGRIFNTNQGRISELLFGKRG